MQNKINTIIIQQLIKNMNSLQACTKCGSIPQDFLVLACTHDLCLSCASLRYLFEMKKNHNANYIVCQQCHQKTQLEEQSVHVLRSITKMQPMNYGQAHNNQYPSSEYSTPEQQTQTDPKTRNQPNSHERQKHRIIAQYYQSIPNKQSCQQHRDEQILYFCFDCKCQCICPQCIIHGKHKQHDVKTIKKAQPLIKLQITNYLKKFQYNVQQLVNKNNQICKITKQLTQSSNNYKKQIQDYFNDLKYKINEKEKQIIHNYDTVLQQSLLQLHKVSENINDQLDHLRQYMFVLNDSTKQQEILFLNFYSRKHQQIQQQLKSHDVVLPTFIMPSNQSIISVILEAQELVNRITLKQKLGNNTSR